ncbi:hypothetical protein LXL04_027301 [Taraxacum kok-saghyz]
MKRRDWGNPHRMQEVQPYRVSEKNGLVFCKRFRESRFFENSYIPENPRTSKPLTFSKNRLRGAKNRSNISPVAKKKFRKNDFFFPKTLHMCKKKKNLHMCTHIFKGVAVLKQNKKLCTYAQKKKFAHMQSFWKKKKVVFSEFFFATGLIFERFLAPRSRFFEKVNVLGSFENSYIPENPRTPPISYITQTVISFKKPTSEPSKTPFPNMLVSPQKQGVIIMPVPRDYTNQMRWKGSSVSWGMSSTWQQSKKRLLKEQKSCTGMPHQFSKEPPEQRGTRQEDVR